MTSIRAFKGIIPQIGEKVYIDENSQIIGKVMIGDDSSVFPGVVIRADVNDVTIGARTNIQDLSMLHVSTPSSEFPNGFPMVIGNDVTIGHKAMLHGCQIGDRVLVGMASIILDGAIIEDDVLVGAGSLVPPGKRLESGYLYFGAPVKQIRKLSEQEIADLLHSAQHYINVKNDYLNF